MRMIRLWKHLLLLKRGGIGMLVGGVNAAARASCAIDCPACPRELPEFNDDMLNSLLALRTSPDDNDSSDDEPPPLLECVLLRKALF